MLNKRWSKIVLAAVMASPIGLLNGVAVGQNVKNEVVAAVPANEPVSAIPDADVIPGVSVSNTGGATLGVVQRVVEHGDKKFALITVGDADSRIGSGVIAVPVYDIWVDGKELKYGMSWTAFTLLPTYDGTAPTWMNKKG